MRRATQTQCAIVFSMPGKGAKETQTQCAPVFSMDKSRDLVGNLKPMWDFLSVLCLPSKCSPNDGPIENTVRSEFGCPLLPCPASKIQLRIEFGFLFSGLSTLFLPETDCPQSHLPNGKKIKSMEFGYPPPPRDAERERSRNPMKTR